MSQPEKPHVMQVETTDMAKAANQVTPRSEEEAREVSAFQIDKTGFNPDDKLLDLRANIVPAEATTAEEMESEFGDLIPKESAPTPAEFSESISQSASSLPVLEKIVSAEEAIGMFRETKTG